MCSTTNLSFTICEIIYLISKINYYYSVCFHPYINDVAFDFTWSILYCMSQFVLLSRFVTRFWLFSYFINLFFFAHFFPGSLYLILTIYMSIILFRKCPGQLTAPSRIPWRTFGKSESRVRLCWRRRGADPRCSTPKWLWNLRMCGRL